MNRRRAAADEIENRYMIVMHINLR
jgi:hypothetical protein